MKKLVLLLCCSLAGMSFVFGTHIVGGGFSYRTVGNNNYRFNLTLFFDYLNGNLGAKDASATCFIFSRSGNALMDSLRFTLVDSSKFLEFSNPECGTRVNLKTQVLEYSANLFMSPNRYVSPQGYYIVWERCCRNNSITNIFEPGATGQTFYMEFPAAVRNAVSFNNGSPVFRTIKSDYPCINQPFSLDFGADDPNGDELRYSLTTPLKGNSTTQVPLGLPPFSAPYDPVLWRTGFSTLNPLQGNPGLQIDPATGLLTCTATLTGLFVFSVRCEEFRNGVKIGEVRREMQTYVVSCPANSAPKVVVRSTNNKVLTDDDTLYLQNGPNGVCQNLTLVDAQRNEPIQYELKIVSGNAPASLAVLRRFRFGSNSDSLFTQFCVPSCQFADPQTPWKILLIATDNGCSQPKRDSLSLYMVVQPLPDNPPQINTVGTFADTLSLIQTEGFSLPVVAVQDQGAELSFSGFITDADGQPYVFPGPIFPTGRGKGPLNDQFRWPEICEIPVAQPLKLTLIVKSDFCTKVQYDTLVRYLVLKPANLLISIASTQLPGEPLFVKEETSIGFQLSGELNANREIRLFAQGEAIFQPGFSFPVSTGNQTVASDFRFEAICGGNTGKYPVKFIVSSRFCGVDYRDSLEYLLDVYYEPDSLGVIPNLLTVNGDDKNEAFSLKRILPKETCANRFEAVEIFNRWGKRVFYSTDLNFIWRPDERMDGVFFYGLYFKNKRFKSWIMVVR